MNGFRLQDPFWLMLLIPLILAGILAIRRQRSVAVLYSDVTVLTSLPVTLALRCKRLLPWVRLIGLALVVVALARPQRGREEFRIRSEGVAIQMCLDRSGSMRALDFQIQGESVDRLTAVKQVFRDFVAGTGELSGRPDDLIGLVAFSGFAESKCPLTLDHGALLQVLDTVQMAQLQQQVQELQQQGREQQIPKGLERRLVEALREEQMTAIGDAVALAVDRLKDVNAKSKVVILLSDGENNAGITTPAEAAEAAKAFGIKIYSIGIGSNGWAPVPDVDAFGRSVLRRQPVRLDEETLKMLATETDGRYFNARDTEALKNVYAEIDRLEKTLSEGRLYTEYRELYQYPMIAGLLLVLIEILLVSTRFRSLP